MDGAQGKVTYRSDEILLSCLLAVPTRFGTLVDITLFCARKLARHHAE
jgi:hypothetical protein